MNFIISEMESTHGRLITVTDEDLIGKYFEQDNRQLDLRKNFYQGTKKNKQEVANLLKGARYLHLTGKFSVAIGVELNLIEASKILYIAGIPHAEAILDG